MGDGNKTMFLFDVDGTLTRPRNVIDKEMADFMVDLCGKVTVGIVGGSDLKKITEQMGGYDKTLAQFEYVFSENGLVFHRNGKLASSTNIVDKMGEDKLQTFINYCLKYMSGITIPKKRGTFVEFRTGLINICPVGRSCSQTERDEFGAYDKIHEIRKKFVKDLEEHFQGYGLCFAIGGQISFDVFPEGWDKTFCLGHIADFKTVHFFGDKTSPGGNDYEIFIDQRTIGHHVDNPEDTRRVVTEVLRSMNS